MHFIKQKTKKKFNTNIRKTEIITLLSTTHWPRATKCWRVFRFPFRPWTQRAKNQKTEKSNQSETKIPHDSGSHLARIFNQRWPSLFDNAARISFDLICNPSAVPRMSVWSVTLFFLIYELKVLATPLPKTKRLLRGVINFGKCSFSGSCCCDPQIAANWKMYTKQITKSEA